MSRQNFLSQGKTSLSRQNFLSQGKIFFLKAKLSFPRQNFLSQGKAFFPKTKLLCQGKTFFLKAKLHFPKTKLSFSRQSFLSHDKTLLGGNQKKPIQCYKGQRYPKLSLFYLSHAKDGWHEYHKRDVLGCSGNLLT